MLKQALAQNGLIAILRGLRPQEAAAIGEVLYAAGFRVIEVPLNSPEPYESIRILRSTLPADCLIGAGTVLTPEQVEQVKAAGGQVIVMPHSDARVLRAAKAAGLYLSPGVATPTKHAAGERSCFRYNRGPLPVCQPRTVHRSDLHRRIVGDQQADQSRRRQTTPHLLQGTQLLISVNLAANALQRRGDGIEICLLSAPFPIELGEQVDALPPQDGAGPLPLRATGQHRRNEIVEPHAPS